MLERFGREVDWYSRVSTAVFVSFVCFSVGWVGVVVGAAAADRVCVGIVVVVVVVAVVVVAVTVAATVLLALVLVMVEVIFCGAELAHFYILVFQELFND